MRRVTGICRARILLTTDAVGGVWTYTLDLAAGLAGAGAVVRVVALGPALTSGQRAQAERSGLDVLGLGHALEWLAAEPREVGTAAAAIAALAGDWGADLVHLHSPAFATAAFGCPVVAVHHSCVATWWAAVRSGSLPDDLAWRADLVGDGLRRADLVLAPSAAHAEAVARCYRLAAIPRVVRNGRAPASSGGGGEARTCDEVFTAGRLWDEGKNLAVLDRAAPLLPWPVRAAGDATGPNGVGVSLPNLSLLGSCSQAEVRRHLAARPIYASPALYEPFGLAVLEAAQAGCALVLADIPTFRESWDEAAIFVDAADAKGFASTLLTLIGDPSRRRALGEAARRRAAGFTVEAMVAATVAAHAGCLDRSARAVAAATAA